MKRIAAIILAAMAGSASAATSFDHLAYSQSGCKLPAFVAVSNEAAAQRTEQEYRNWQACYNRYAERLNAEFDSNEALGQDTYLKLVQEAEDAAAEAQLQRARWIGQSRALAAARAAAFASDWNAHARRVSMTAAESRGTYYGARH
ncbi:hypothetical protein [Pseudoduganella rhizocola]|uniref:hypothetical protein n=1 Tax=Pseudoduganella rhizocola TaxID=3382643 RepID=UPI0038B619E4